MFFVRCLLVGFLTLSMTIAPVSAGCCDYYYDSCSSCSSCGPCCEVEYVEVVECGCSDCYETTCDSCSDCDSSPSCDSCVSECDTCEAVEEVVSSSCESCGEVVSESPVVADPEPAVMENHEAPTPAMEEAPIVEEPVVEETVTAEPVPAVITPSTPAETPAPVVDSTPDPVAPVEEPTPGPAEDPVAEDPAAEDSEELFDTSEEDPVAPMEEEAEESLFGDDTSEDDFLDDAAPAEESAPEEETPEAPAEEESSDFEDIFGMQQTIEILSQRGGLKSEKTRNWTDNTGIYQCEARMVEISPKGVVLQKDSGAKKAVPLKRLSNADLQFVKQQVQAKQNLLAYQAVNEKLAAK